MHITQLPIEPLVSRYSKQWETWMTQGLQDHGCEVLNIAGASVPETIDTGAFLDVFNTNVYKASQVVVLAQYMRHLKTDWVFFHDLWHPGVIPLAYMRDGAKRPFKIAGCLHAGTWDSYDFLSLSGMAVWAKHFELCIFDIVDLVFVATHYHKQLIRNYLGRQVHDKIMVTGFPIYPQRAVVDYDGKDPNLVVFPHRMDPEKDPAMFKQLEADLKDSGLRFECTMETCKTKKEYYDKLTQASIAVSCAKQETWGIAMQEAVFAGCVPIVPDRLSYVDMYPARFRYELEGQLKQLVLNARSDLPRWREKAWQAAQTFKVQGDLAVGIMVEEMAKKHYGCKNLFRLRRT